MGGSSAQYLCCKAFHDWSIINMQERNHFYKTGIYLLHFLKQHLTAFVDLLYWCGLEKRASFFDVFFSVIFFACAGCLPSGTKNCQNVVVTGVYGKTNTGLGSKEEYQACFVGYLGCNICVY